MKIKRSLFHLQMCEPCLVADACHPRLRQEEFKVKTVCAKVLDQRRMGHGMWCCWNVPDNDRDTDEIV